MRVCDCRFVLEFFTAVYFEKMKNFDSRTNFDHKNLAKTVDF